MNTAINKGFLYTLLFTPIFVFAQDVSWLEDLFGGVVDVVVDFVPPLIGLALILFVWGLVKYLYRKSDENSVKQAKQFMVWGVVAMFTLVAIWGIVALMQTIFGTPVIDPPNPPQTQYAP